jgi:hypothetical protein
MCWIIRFGCTGRQVESWSQHLYNFAFPRTPTTSSLDFDSPTNPSIELLDSSAFAIPSFLVIIILLIILVLIRLHDRFSLTTPCDHFLIVILSFLLVIIRLFILYPLSTIL